MELVVAGRDEDIVWEFMPSEGQPTPVEITGCRRKGDATGRGKG